jgi:hypothetical protein
VLYALDELGGYDYNAKKREKDPSPKSQTLLAVCRRGQKVGHQDRTILQWPRIVPVMPREVYPTQDDRQFDSVLIAASAIFGVRGGVGHGDRIHNLTHSGPERTQNLGLALMWTEIITPDALNSALGETDIPSEARTALIQNFQQLSQLVPADSLSDIQRQLLVEIPLEVYRQRKEHYAKYADSYAQLADLMKKTDDGSGDETIASLRKLRRDFIAKCGDPSCERMPLFADGTSKLAQLHVLRNELLEARVESQLHRHDGDYVAGFTQAIRVAQDLAVRRLRETKEKFDRARKNGSDDAMAEKLAGGRGAEIAHQLLIPVKMQLPNYAAATDKKSERMFANSKTVAGVSTAGAEATVRFKKLRIERRIPYNCRRTNRIDRIDRYGWVRYERICQYRDAVEIKDSNTPITLPVAEAEHLQAGDILSFMTLEGESRVVSVTRGEERVQVRDVVLR